MAPCAGRLIHRLLFSHGNYVKLLLMTLQQSLDRSMIASSQQAVRRTPLHQSLDKPLVSRGVGAVEKVRFSEGPKKNEIVSTVHSFDDTNAAIKHRNAINGDQFQTSFYSAKVKYLMVSVQPKPQDHPSINLFA